MKKKFTLLFLCFLSIYSYAQLSKKPQFISMNSMVGTVLPTNDFVSGKNKIGNYGSVSLRYGVSSQAYSIDDYIYGLPYWGLGVYGAKLNRKNDLGTPYSIYVFQGARLFQINDRLGVNYEWNLGCSFNWKYYDPFDNPNNVAISSSMNVHIAGNIYMKWAFSKKFDLNVGFSATHFSNGSSHQPNSGINMVAGFVGLAYNITREQFISKKYIGDELFEFQKRIDHDIAFTITNKNVAIDSVGTGLSTPYPKRDFRVLGASYSLMFAESIRFKWGPSVEFTYDESGGMKSWAETNHLTGKMMDRIELGEIHDRISVGLSAKGEVSMPLYSIFANLGYDVIQAKTNESRFYQIVGVKVPVTKNLYGTFGIRATNFSSAQYLYWSVGYSIKQKRKGISVY